MKVGLIDVDGHNFPNLPLMKLSAYHKSLEIVSNGMNRCSAVIWIEFI